MFNMLIHCSTLGKTPKMKNIHNSFTVIKNVTPIEHIWDWTAECSRRNGGINNLLIACHGSYEGPVKEGFGGWGISLGTGLHQDNAKYAEKIAGLVKTIYLYVCSGAQEPDPGLLSPGQDYENYAHNRTTCRLLAKHSKCNVNAAQSVQKYTTSRWTGSFDFGDWEGKVERFTPGGAILDVTVLMNSFGNE